MQREIPMAGFVPLHALHTHSALRNLTNAAMAPYCSTEDERRLVEKPRQTAYARARASTCSILVPPSVFSEPLVDLLTGAAARPLSSALSLLLLTVSLFLFCFCGHPSVFSVACLSLHCSSSSFLHAICPLSRLFT